MTGTTEVLLAVLKLATVAAGFYIAYLGFKAFRRTRQKAVLWLSVGMLILTLGAISEGAAYQGLSWTLDQSHVFEAVVTLAGFLVLVYSLLAK